MSAFFSIVVYTFCWLISYLLAKRQYGIAIRCYNHNKGVSTRGSVYTRKMPMGLIIVISLIFTYYCHFSMAPEDMMAGDRQNYLVNFAGDRESPSIGLMVILAMIHLNGGDFHTLLYFCTFISMVVTLLAYRYSKVATPESLLLLFLSQYVLTSLTALKQCYASAFSALAIVLMLQDRSKIKELLIYALIILAILFHPTGYVLVPVYLLIRFYGNRDINIERFVLPLLLFALLFIPVMQILASALSSALPMLSGKIEDYFGEGNETGVDDNNIVTIFKGFPFYIITFMGIKYRKLLQNEIPLFNGYMIVTLLCSFLYIMNIYSVWMSRFMFLFQLPIYIFFFMMTRKLKFGKRYTFWVYLLTAVVTYRFLYIVGGYF